MDTERTLQLISQRHSVRKYLPKPLDNAALNALENEIAQVNAVSGLCITYVPGDAAFKGAAFRMLGWKKPQGCIALAGPSSDKLEELVGYWGEHLVLYCQDLGLNTCWAGMAKKRNVALDLPEGCEYVLGIAVGYGETSGEAHKSKSFDDVTRIAPRTASTKTAANTDAAANAGAGVPDWFRAGVECALLAPTAINQQKFTITLEADNSVSFAAQKGPFSHVDLGIVKYHFEVASGQKVF